MNVDDLVVLLNWLETEFPDGPPGVRPMVSRGNTDRRVLVFHVWPTPFLSVSVTLARYHRLCGDGRPKPMSEIQKYVKAEIGRMVDESRSHIASIIPHAPI